MAAASASRCVFVAGATGYMAGSVVPLLLARGHLVRALTRSASTSRVPTGATPVIGDALDSATYGAQVAPADTFLHLIGVPHPSPAKAALFRSVDLPALRASLEAAKSAGIRHFVYVSVAHPAPVMK